MPDYENPYYYALAKAGVFDTDEQIQRGDLQRYIPTLPVSTFATADGYNQRYIPGLSDDAFTTVKRDNPYAYNTIPVHPVGINPVGVKPDKKKWNTGYFIPRKYWGWRKDARQAKTPLTDEQKAENNFNRTLGFDKVRSALKNAAMYDSFVKWAQKKSNTPDNSDLENYKNHAFRETQVARANPYLIGGNNYLTYTPYDYMEEANRINATAANGLNLLSRQSRGNFNALAANIQNMLMNTSKSVGDAARKARQENEEQRRAIAAHNLGIDQTNATALNNAENDYTRTLNSQRAADKQNQINALLTYGNQRYARQKAYEAEVDKARDEAITNLTNYGLNAYERNRANSNLGRNYYSDPFGIMHYKPGASGALTGDDTQTAATSFDSNLFDMMYDDADDATKKELAKMTPAQLTEYFKKNYAKK